MRHPTRTNAKQPLSSKVKDFIDVMLYGPLSIIRHIWIQLVLLLFMFGFGTLVFMDYQHLNLLTAFLGSVSTITTIGIYTPTIVGMSPSEQVLLIFTFIVSVGLAASIIQSTITSVISKNLLREQLMRKRIGRLEDHAIIAGYSYLGKYVSEWLTRTGVRQVIIARDPSSAKAAVAEGLLAIDAPTTRSFEVLNEARAKKASTLVCAFDDDGDNLLVAMSARKLNPDLRVIVVVHDRDLVASAVASDIDVVLPIFDVAANALAMSAVAGEIEGMFLPGALEEGRFPNAPYILDFLVADGQGAGKSYGKLNKVAPILMVVRDGGALPNPSDDFELKAGDFLLVLASAPQSIEEFRIALSDYRDDKSGAGE
ncbi:MAG: NAD-binding protein [Nitrososphaerota archaeon]|nr:NAD-binding protein [Nitrososphaerota archaeon]